MAQPASLLLVVAALFSAVLAAAAGLARDRSRSTVRFMFLANVGTLAWTSAHYVQLVWSHYPDASLAPVSSGDYILALILAIGMGMALTYWFLFCADLSPRGSWWTHGTGLWVAHLPAFYLFAAVATNPFHHLFLAPTPAGPAPGILSIPHYVTVLSLLVGGMAYVVPAPREGFLSSHERRSRLAVALAACLPLAGTLAWTARRLALISLPINPTPALFSLVCGIIGYQVLYRGLGDIVPLATLSSMVQHTDTYLAYLSPAFRFVSVNQAFLRRSRRTDREILGRDYFDVMPDDDRRVLFEQARRERRPVERTDDDRFFPRGADEPVAYWSWWLTPVVDASDRLQGFVLSVAEVTESIRQRELARTLAELDLSLHRDFASDPVGWDVVASAAEALGTRPALLTRSEQHGWRMRNDGSPVRGEPYDPEVYPHVALAMDTASTIVVSDATVDDRIEPTMMAALRIRSALVVPLVSHHGVLGALSFERTETCGTFAAAEIDFAQRFAAAATLALENARLYHDERRIAQTLQESMLRVSFQVPGVDFSHKYRSATEAARVGGDFYDLFQTDDGRVGMLIGDVSGHGIEAAVLTSLIKNTVRAQAIGQDSPARIMRKVNDVLWRQTDVEIFATAFLGFLHVDDGVLRYCCAGHPAALRLQEDGTVVELPQKSVIVGALPNATFATAQARLEPGETLVLYTDGLTEARRGSELFGTHRLREALASLACRTAGDVIDTLFETVSRYSNDSFSDDVALVAVRLLPPAQRAGLPKPTAAVG